MSTWGGSFKPQASEGIIEEWEVLDLLTRLVEKSLVVYDEQEDRYHLMETIRDYGRNLLNDRNEANEWRIRHCNFFLQLAEESWPHLRGPEQAEWFERLETEYDNLRAALEWVVPHNDEAGLRLTRALGLFWETRSHLEEGRAWLTDILTRAADAPERLRAQAHVSAGNLALVQGDYGAARLHHYESLAIFRRMGDNRYIAAALNNVGLVIEQQGDYQEAYALFEESLTLKRALQSESGIAISLNNLANVRREQGDYAAAAALLEEALALLRTLGDQRVLANALTNLATVVRLQKDYAKARALLKESLTIRQELQDKRGFVYSLEGFAALAASLEQSEMAARLFGSAESLRETIGIPLPPSERDRYDRDVATAYADLGKEAFAAAWAEGRAMTLEQAIEYALNS